MAHRKRIIPFKSNNIVGIGIFALLLLYTGYKLYKTSSVVIPTPAPTQAVMATVSPVAVNPNAKCHIQGVLPDANCTPGEIDPHVTQANIHQTICVSGYTKKVRPPESYTNKLKSQQIAKYGYADIKMHDYEEDHLISLELGGAPSNPKNLWPEPGRSPNPKDHIENLCHKKVCNGEISLADAQHEIATNWQTACQ